MGLFRDSSFFIVASPLLDHFSSWMDSAFGWQKREEGIWRIAWEVLVARLEMAHSTSAFLPLVRIWLHDHSNCKGGREM